MSTRQATHFLYPVLLTLCILSLVTPASAGDNATTLKELVVTAEKFPVSEKESVRFVSVFSSEELKETGANNLVDALKRKGGLAYKAFAPLGISHGGMNSTLFIRGIENGELILINGSPVQGSAGHSYDLNMIPIDQIERVEVLKGAASALYGADAMTGVINIITKKNVPKASAKAYTEFGSKGYQKHGISYMGPLLNLGINYSHLNGIEEISRNFSRGYRYDTDDTDQYSLNLNATPLKNLYLDYLGSYNETGFKKIFDTATPFKGTDQKQYKHFSDLRYEKNNIKLKAFLSYDRMDRNEYTSISKPDDSNKNYNYGTEGNFKIDLSGIELSAGADYVYHAADYNNKYGKQSRNDYAAFFQIKKEFLERLTITIGGREQFIDAESGSKDCNRFLPSAGLNFKASNALNLFANAGKAFRTPTFNNLYYSSSFLVGNPDLDPEEGWTYEAGIKYDDRFTRLQLAAFSMDYKDKITIDSSQGYPLTYFNAGNFQTLGIEWDATFSPFVNQYSFLQNVFMDLAGYWADPTAEDTSGEEFQAGPKFQTNLGLSYQTKEMLMNFNCSILRSRERGLDNTSTLDFYSKYMLFKGYLTFAVDNVFDEKVQISGDMTATATNQYAYYDLGRLIKVGYEITF